MIAALPLLLALQGNPAAPPVQEEAPRRYGDQGSSHLGLVLGLGGGNGGVRWAGGVDYGYFVLDGVAPGVDTQIAGGTGLLTTSMLLGTVRLVPIRTEAFSLFLVGRAGRVLLSHHDDGWAAGGGAGLIFFTGARIGVQLAYDVLKLLPDTFCADLSGGCVVQGLQAGIVAGF
jgi:hypothetical protein